MRRVARRSRGNRPGALARAASATAGALLVEGEVRGTWRRAHRTVKVDTWGRLSGARRQAVEGTGGTPAARARGPHRRRVERLTAFIPAHGAFPYRSWPVNIAPPEEGSLDRKQYTDWDLWGTRSVRVASRISSSVRG